MKSLSRRMSYLTSEGGPTRRALKTEPRFPYQGRAPEARPIKNKWFICPGCKKPFIVEKTDVSYCSEKCNHDANP